MTLVKFEKVNKHFNIESRLLRRTIGRNLVLSDISFEINRGESLGLVGESGSGKTTIAKLLVGLLKPDSGSILIDSRSISDYKRKDLALRVQMIFQDPFSSLNPRLSIKTIIGEAVKVRLGKNENAGHDADAVNKEVVRLLNTVGLPVNIMDNYPHQFSGGQRQRIAIARALAFKPELIIADEPLSSLDVSIQAQIINLFLDLKRDYNLSYLFISHDITLVSYFSDNIIVLKNGEIVEENETGKLVHSPQNEYTKELISSVF